MTWSRSATNCLVPACGMFEMYIAGTVTCRSACTFVATLLVPRVRGQTCKIALIFCRKPCVLIHYGGIDRVNIDHRPFHHV